MTGPRGFRAHKLTLSMLTSFLLAIFLILIISGCGESSTPVTLRDPSRTPGQPIADGKQLTIDDLLYSEFVSEMRISPDATQLAWVKTGNNQGQDLASSNLYITDLADLTTTQLTGFSQNWLGNIRWSPDSTSLAFISDAPLPGGDESASIPRVWQWTAGGGEPNPIDTGNLAPELLEWRNPGVLIMAAVDVGTVDEDKATPADDTIHVTDDADTARLYELPVTNSITRGPVTSTAPRQITDNDDNMLDLSVSPDGSYAFVVRSKGAGIGYIANQPPQTCYLVKLDTGAFTQVLPDVTATLGSSWATDSSRVYVAQRYSSDPMRPLIFRVQIESVSSPDGANTPTDLSWGRGLDNMSPLGYTCPTISTFEGGFTGFLADGYNPRVALFESNGSGQVEQQQLEGRDQGNIFSLVISSDGKTVCYEYSTTTEPVQLYTARIEDGKIVEPRQITNLNQQYDGKQVSRAEKISWQGARGDTVEGMLYYPVDYQPGQRYPLVLVIHGGPFESDKDRWPFGAYTWVDPYRLMNQKGAFALSVNYHGSASYGETSEDWGNSMADSQFYGYALEDLESAIDRLVELGMVDEDRLGTMGWSGGGMLTNGLIATDTRFKAASAGAGGAEWISLWGPCRFGDAITKTYFGQDPVENPDLFREPRTNPFYDASKVVTPTIMFTGDADENVPAAMTWVTYRGIQLHGQAPVELYVAPGEPHVYEQVSHQKRKMIEEQKWFDEYLFGTGG